MAWSKPARFGGSEADMCDWLIEREAQFGWIACALPEGGVNGGTC